MAPVSSTLASSQTLERCTRCPRLVALRAQVRRAHPEYHAAPVPPWGSRRARLLIVGLAPGMHGANRTGRPFTGDASGRFLFETLHRYGFASQGDANRAALVGARITNAVKCLPPQNRPSAEERQRCLDFLRSELRDLTGEQPRRSRVVLCLGRLAHESVSRALAEPLSDFRHGGETTLGRLVVCDTYHPSRQNTNTGRLTRTMLDAVLARVRTLLET